MIQLDKNEAMLIRRWAWTEITTLRHRLDDLYRKEAPDFLISATISAIDTCQNLYDKASDEYDRSMARDIALENLLYGTRSLTNLLESQDAIWN